MSNSSPAVGAAAPSFEALPVVGAEGESLSSAMLDGQRYVLYFYPKDDTPGCTTQACDFRDQGAAFEALGYKIFGVSPDSVKRHVNFREKYGLPFPLVSDPEHLLAERFGVWREKKITDAFTWGSSAQPSWSTRRAFSFTASRMFARRVM